MSEYNNNLLEVVDAKTQLAGSNHMELLTFSLGTNELFGINVFKVREVTHTPAITLTPNMPFGVEGVISLRGNIIPVIALHKYMNIPQDLPPDCTSTMIVTEYNRHIRGFLVQSVDRIVRVDWANVKAPEGMLADKDGVVSAITQLPEGNLVSILHIEQILAKLVGETEIPDIAPVSLPDHQMVFMVDDSTIARKEIAGVLDKLQVRYQLATNGLEAWEKLQSLASRVPPGGSLRDQLRLILTDAEMPTMDGYVLTHQIKSDERFKGIPVIMHSSLSSEANRAMGQQAGVDAYVSKFDPITLADAIRPYL